MLIFLLSLRYPKTNIPGLQVAEGQGAGHGRLSFLFWTLKPQPSPISTRIPTSSELAFRLYKVQTSRLSTNHLPEMVQKQGYSAYSV